MAAHAQYCSTGDYTLRATELGVANVVKEEADDYFVFVLSDANLSRYDVSTDQLKKALTKDKRVNAHLIFIASMVDEAAKIRDGLPLGKGHVCLDTSLLPLTFKQIFASSAISD